LAGDDKYGDFAWNKSLGRQGLKRMFLHAWRLGLPHPLESREIAFEAPLPPDLANFVARLKAGNSDDA
jgi:23S rRNA pseudouridine955/2504/2580 synthase